MNDNGIGNLGVPLVDSNIVFPHSWDHFLSTYIDLAKSDAVSRPVDELLASDERVQSLTDGLAQQNWDSNHFSLKIWFTWRWNEVGKDQATEDLNAFLDTDEVERLHLLWLTGLETDSVHQLTEEIRLSPFNELPFFDDRFWITQQSITSPTAAYTPKAALVVRSKEPRLPATDSPDLSHIYRPMYDTADLINAVPNHFCTVLRQTSCVNDGTPPGPFGGRSANHPHYDSVGHNRCRFDAESIPLISEALDCYSRLPESEQDWLHVILRRISQAKQFNSLNNQILDLGVALEMLLLSDNSSTDQLSLTFRLRGAWLLGRDTAERITLYEQFKKAYNFRSKVAHTGMPGKPKAAQEMRQLLPTFVELTEKALQKLLLDGKPDWDSLVLGSTPSSGEA